MEFRFWIKGGTSMVVIVGNGMMFFQLIYVGPICFSRHATGHTRNNVPSNHIGMFLKLISVSHYSHLSTH